MVKEHGKSIRKRGRKEENPKSEARNPKQNSKSEIRMIKIPGSSFLIATGAVFARLLSMWPDRNRRVSHRRSESQVGRHQVFTRPIRMVPRLRWPIRTRRALSGRNLAKEPRVRLAEQPARRPTIPELAVARHGPSHQLSRAAGRRRMPSPPRRPPTRLRSGRESERTSPAWIARCIAAKVFLAVCGIRVPEPACPHPRPLSRSTGRGRKPYSNANRPVHHASCRRGTTNCRAPSNPWLPTGHS